MTGRTRGIQFERDVCKRLSLWWSSGKDDSIFWRTQTSGGRARTRAKKGVNLKGQHGDICALGPEGKPFTDAFVVELKKGYPQLSLHDLLDRPSNGKPPKDSYEGWIAKTLEAQKQAGTWSWLLITMRRQRAVLVSMPFDDFDKILGEEYCGVMPHATFFARHKEKNINIITVQLDDWLEAMSLERIRGRV